MSISDRTSIAPGFDQGRILRRFTNRHDLTRVFCSYLQQKKTPEKLLYFIGAGGNDKSILLQFLQISCCKKLPDEV